MDAAQRLNGALSALPEVRDCAVLERLASDGTSWLVAYVVPDAGFDASTLLHDQRVALALSDRLQVACVPLARIPKTDSGELDSATLCALPVAESIALEGWRNELLVLPGVADVELRRITRARAAVPLHLTDLLDDERAGCSATPPASRAVLPLPSSLPNAGRAAYASGGESIAARHEFRELGDALRAAAARTPQRGMLLVSERGAEFSLSYPELLRRAETVALGLHARRVTNGTRALLRLANPNDFFPAFWGCVLAGVVVVPVATGGVARSVLLQAQDSAHAAVIIATQGEIHELAGLQFGGAVELLPMESLAGQLDPPVPNASETPPAPRSVDHVALMMLTSGSTGKPKGVPLTHRHLLSQCLGAIAQIGLSQSDRSLNWMPLDHVAALVLCHLRDTILGLEQVYCAPAYILADELRWLEILEKYRCSVSFAPNFAFGGVTRRESALDARRFDLAHVRAIVNGGEAISARTARRFLQLLAPHGLPATAMVPAWGMSETASGTTYSTAFRIESTTDEDPHVEVGPPIAGSEIRIVDADGHTIGEDSIGRVEVRGANVISSYFENPIANRQSFSADGWLRTGDLGFLRRQSLTITGREKDVVIVNGVNYHCHEIEAAAELVEELESSFVAACAVRGPGDDTDQVAVFFHTLVTDSELLRAIIADVRAQVAHRIGSAPAYVLPVGRDEIPKTTLGKIRRSDLAQRFMSGDFAAQMKFVDCLLASSATVPDWFFQKIQIPKAIAPSSEGESDGTTILFLGSSREERGNLATRGLDESSTIRVFSGDRFSAITERNYEVDPQSAAQMEALAKAIGAQGRRIGRTIFLCSGSAPSDDAGRHAGGAAVQSCADVTAVLNWLHALAGSGQLEPGHMFLVLSFFPDSEEESAEAAGFEASAISGLLRSATREYAKFRFCHLSMPASAALAASQRILDEFSAHLADELVTYRATRRSVMGLARTRFPSRKPHSASGFIKGGLYVITGGLGNIGFEVSRRLLVEYEARVLIVGRTRFALGEALQHVTDIERAVYARRLDELRHLSPAGLRYAAADVRDWGALDAAIAAAEQAWNSRIDGCLHLAGAYPQTLIRDATAQSLLDTLGAQVEATQNLARILEARPNAMLVIFSSVVGSSPTASMGAYAAASCHLEAFAAHLRALGRSRCHWIAWTGWLGAGWDKDTIGLLAARGYLPISPTAGWKSLQVVLRHDLRNVLVGLDVGHIETRRMLEFEPRPLEFCEAICWTEGRHDAESRAPVLIDRFGTDVSPEIRWLPRARRSSLSSGAAQTDATGLDRESVNVEPRGPLEAAIRKIWREVLRREDVNVTRSLFDLGGGSLHAIQIGSRLLDQFGVDLPVQLLLGRPTIEAMALAVLEKQMASLPQAIAEQLLASSEATHG